MLDIFHLALQTLSLPSALHSAVGELLYGLHNSLPYLLVSSWVWPMEASERAQRKKNEVMVLIFLPSPPITVGSPWILLQLKVLPPVRICSIQLLWLLILVTAPSSYPLWYRGHKSPNYSWVLQAPLEFSFTLFHLCTWPYIQSTQFGSAFSTEPSWTQGRQKTITDLEEIPLLLILNPISI